MLHLHFIEGQPLITYSRRYDFTNVGDVEDLLDFASLKQIFFFIGDNESSREHGSVKRTIGGEANSRQDTDGQGSKQATVEQINVKQASKQMMTLQDTVHDIRALMWKAWERPTRVLPENGHCCLPTHLLERFMSTADDIVRNAASAKDFDAEDPHATPSNTSYCTAIWLEYIINATDILREHELSSKIEPFLLHPRLFKVSSLDYFLHKPYRYLAILGNDVYDDVLQDDAILKSEVFSALCMAKEALCPWLSGGPPDSGDIYVRIAC